jgi:hypothetical protein
MQARAKGLFALVLRVKKEKGVSWRRPGIAGFKPMLFAGIKLTKQHV